MTDDRTIPFGRLVLIEVGGERAVAMPALDGETEQPKLTEWENTAVLAWKDLGLVLTEENLRDVCTELLKLHHGYSDRDIHRLNASFGSAFASARAARTTPTHEQMPTRRSAMTTGSRRRRR